MECGIVAVMEACGTVYCRAAKVNYIIAVKGKVHILQAHLFLILMAEIVKLLFDMPGTKILRVKQHQVFTRIFCAAILGF